MKLKKKKKSQLKKRDLHVFEHYHFISHGSLKHNLPKNMKLKKTNLKSKII
jgi:hypothetical protein